MQRDEHKCQSESGPGMRRDRAGNDHAHVDLCGDDDRGPCEFPERPVVRSVWSHRLSNDRQVGEQRHRLLSAGCLQRAAAHRGLYPRYGDRSPDHERVPDPDPNDDPDQSSTAATDADGPGDDYSSDGDEYRDGNGWHAYGDGHVSWNTNERGDSLRDTHPDECGDRGANLCPTPGSMPSDWYVCERRVFLWHRR